MIFSPATGLVGWINAHKLSISNPPADLKGVRSRTSFRCQTKEIQSSRRRAASMRWISRSRRAPPSPEEVDHLGDRQVGLHHRRERCWGRAKTARVNRASCELSRRGTPDLNSFTT